jgi:cardiolipin synthase/putative cardiolipin synthase
MDDDWLDSDPDFTIARGIHDAEKIKELRDYFASRRTAVVNTKRTALNDVLEKWATLSKSEAESLFTGLVIAGVAEERGGGSTFADYTFRVECGPSSKVLEGQRIGRKAMEQVLAEQKESRTILTATLPPAIRVDSDTNLRPLSSDIRQLFFDADSVVRIANPYFDASPTVIGDIASLADRGVTTKILTRETSSNDPKLTSTLNTIHKKISPDKRHFLEVRDLYQENDRTGRQSYATHAKIAIADDSPCYVGSANLTEMNLSNNFEMGVLLWGEVVDDAIDVFNAVFDSARKVSLPL